MSPEIALLFWGLVLFETKHFFCDFVLQTRYQAQNKGTYGHPGGLIHAGVHSLGSIPAIVLLTRSPVLIGSLLLGEWLVHYHTDWLKQRLNAARGLGYEDMLYWMVFGADQFVHQLTYVTMLAVIVRFGS